LNALNPSAIWNLIASELMLTNPVNVSYLRETASLLQRLKERSYELMALRPGMRVLDAGCGPGVDTIPLARLVGPTGQIVGVDPDPAMLKAADEAAQAAGVSGVLHVTGTATALSFPDGHFDACRAERLLQVLSPADALEVIAELARVLKPGGRLVLCDTDWSSASVDYSDDALERRLLRFFGEKMRPNGNAGRRLLRHLRDAGLGDRSLEAWPVVARDLEQAPVGEWLIEEARDAGVATEAELDAWRSELQAASRDGTFLMVTHMNLACGAKPPAA
jgi:ubiquinone/menaquinone biosynthesis C-methylase UbiE